MTYEKYCAQMKERTHKPMTKKQFDEMMGITNEPIVEPLQIRPRNQRAVMPTIENYTKVELVKKTKVERKPRTKMSEEELRIKKRDIETKYKATEKGRLIRRKVNTNYYIKNKESIKAAARRRYHEQKESSESN